MIPILLVTHGGLADGMVESAEMLVGKSEKLETLSLRADDDFGAFQRAVEECVERLDEGGGVLVLLDLLGGSPYNAAAMSLDNVHMESLAGLNLSMLLTALDQREYCDLPQLAEECREAAISNIVSVREKLSQAALDNN